MNTSENWRAVPSVPGLEASDLGRLRVVNYPHRMRDGSVRIRSSSGGVGQWDGTRFIYRIRGKTYKVARLVCEAFQGPAPANLPYCLHSDEDARNNRPDNLRWGTQKENLNAPGFLAYCRGRTGDHSPTTIARARRATKG